MKVQSKCQVESGGFLPATKMKYFVFCVSILRLLKIIKQKILTGRAPALQAFSSHYSPPLYIALAQPLLCLTDMAKLQCCDSQHVLYYIFVCSCVESRGKREILKV